jgi:hypothetical protein
MTDETNRSAGPEPAHDDAGVPPAEPAAEHTGGWEPGGETRSAQAREWLSQLQQMIDRIAAEAAPVARDVAAKAAELAAVAGEKAGPLARRAAEVTDDVGTKVAERSRRFAEEVRHRAAEGGAAPADAPAAGEADAPAPDVMDAPPEEPRA